MTDCIWQSGERSPNLCVVACRERVRQRRADGAEKEIRPSNAAEQEEQPSTLEVHQFGDTLEKPFSFKKKTHCCRKMLKTRRCYAQPSHTSWKRSARSSTAPSVPSHASAGEETKEQAKARLQEIESIRDYLRRQARKADHFNAQDKPEARTSMDLSSEAGTAI